MTTLKARFRTARSASAILLKQGAFKAGELIVGHGPGEILWDELTR